MTAKLDNSEILSGQMIEAWTIKVGDVLPGGSTVVAVDCYQIGEANDSRIAITESDGNYFDVPYWEMLELAGDN